MSVSSCPSNPCLLHGDPVVVAEDRAKANRDANQICFTTACATDFNPRSQVLLQAARQRIRNGMANTNDRIRVWDLPVRLFHWALVVLIATSYFSGQAGGDWMKLHFWSGYAILTLLLFRIVWGFVGSTTARFSNFVKGPTAWLVYLRDLLTSRRTYDVGHNPVGGIMVLLLI